MSEPIDIGVIASRPLPPGSASGDPEQATTPEEEREYAEDLECAHGEKPDATVRSRGGNTLGHVSLLALPMMVFDNPVWPTLKAYFGPPGDH